MRFLLRGWICLQLLGAGVIVGAEFPDAFFAEYCFDCHDDLTQEAEVQLDNAIDLDWGKPETHHFFERVLDVVSDGAMPPKDEAHRPSKEESKALKEWLHRELLEHSKVGGTVLRRLNQVEYEKTITSVFGFDYKVPPGFPADQTSHGFDNQGEALLLSPPLMESYVEAAAQVADKLFPPIGKPVPVSLFTAMPEEMVISYSSGYIIDGAMRLASKSAPVSRSCTWPTKFEAKGSGTYRVKIDLSQFKGIGKSPMRLQLRAKKVSDDDSVDVNSLRLLTEFEVTEDEPKSFEKTVEIYAGETLICYFANAPLDSDRESKEVFADYLRSEFESKPELFAGWLAVEHNSGLRGGVGWERVKKKMASPDLKVGEVVLDSKEGKALISTMLKNPVLYVETISYQLFEEGPALEIHALEIEGPFLKVEDDEACERKKWLERFSEEVPLDSGADSISAILSSFLTKAFRRPAEEAEVRAYQKLVMTHRESGHSLEDAIHLGIRTALISPQFLYRETAEGALDNWGIASRLSYFLINAPADRKLLEAAEKERLTIPGVLEFQTEKLLEENRIQEFVSGFTAQWLGLTHLDDIMPDPRLLNFNDNDRKGVIRETELFVGEILKKNLPLETFVDPDFTFLDQALAKKIYNRKDVKSKGFTRVSLEPGSPYGGIFGQGSVMMATANGVDTEPVSRGVWMLENVLGDAPPPPPKNVPAITPDTRGAKTIRELLDAHRSDESCARCHVKMDPLGYVLENFDPVGRWRTHYPIYDKKGKATDGPKIDATGTMPDGYAFTHVNDLKRYVVENLDQFANCLAEKLMTYATGRTLTYADREAIKPIVAANLENKEGFRDLIIALVGSEVFLTK